MITSEEKYIMKRKCKTSKEGIKSYFGLSGLFPLAPKGSRRLITLREPASPSPYCESGELCCMARSSCCKLLSKYPNCVFTMVFLKDDLKCCCISWDDKDLDTVFEVLDALLEVRAFIDAMTAWTDPDAVVTMLSELGLCRDGSLPRRTCKRKKIWLKFFTNANLTWAGLAMINTSAILDKITIQTARAHCLLIKVNIPRLRKKADYVQRSKKWNSKAVLTDGLVFGVFIRVVF